MDQDGKGEGAVLVVKDGKIIRTKVKAGRDNGSHVEILDGLSDKDQVVLQPDASMADGTEVHVEPAAVVGGPPKTGSSGDGNPKRPDPA